MDFYKLQNHKKAIRDQKFEQFSLKLFNQDS